MAQLIIRIATTNQTGNFTMHARHCFALLFLLVTCVAVGHSEEPAPSDIPQVKHLIDTHIHLYDTRRPAGVPWPPQSDKVLYKPHLPEEFVRVSRKAGVTGVVVVEASDRLSDNRWVLDQVQGNDYFIALVGNIDLTAEDFSEQLTTLAQDKRFVGIRARNPQPIDFSDALVIKNLCTLAKQGLTLDMLINGKGIQGVQQVDRVARAVPELRIVVDHVLGFDIEGKPPSLEWITAATRLAEKPNVWCKVSGLYQRCVQQPAPADVDHYRPLLDTLWELFGAKRLIYGSNWPCTKKSGDYASYVRLVNSYFAEKGPDASERYFWKNAAEAYRLPLK